MGRTIGAVRDVLPRRNRHNTRDMSQRANRREDLFHFVIAYPCFRGQLTPKAGVSDDKMEEILASIRALTHIPGVVAISAGQNVTDRANGATHGVLVTLEGADDLPAYLNHPDHQAVGAVLREHCEVLALDYER